MTPRSCFIGAVDVHVAKLSALAAVGVTHFNAYLVSGEEERALEAYGKEIIPALRGIPMGTSARRPS